MDGNASAGDSEGDNDGEQHTKNVKRLKVECIIGDRSESELRETHP